MKQKTRKEIYDVLTKTNSRHGRGTEWIKENRRRRSAGLPQKRLLPDGSVFDPLN